MMDRPTYTFKIGQFVFYHDQGRHRKWRTGPYIVVGLVRHSDGRILYRIKSRAQEHLAHEDELKLALARPVSDE